jgi:type I restriction-modification system DNA methylase subunit
MKAKDILYMTEQNFNAAFERVCKLAADFQKHEKVYLAPDYKEDSVRKDFIDKFWIALGWDVYHERQTNPYEQDVKPEKNVDVKGRIKKADYAFLAANFRDVRFFVEAKKPSRNIDNADDYFQTIRYGWNAQTSISILTDFEQFRVLDCRYKPDVQTALNRSIPELKLHYTEYRDAEKFKKIYHLFSRDAVVDGALDRFIATLPKPTGRATQRGLFGGSYKSVDEDFLSELDELREELARSFKNRNPQLNGEDLTEATQRTIDRLVFMRFLEDKLIEPEVIVEKLGESGSAWADFVSQSKRLNGIYNGIIFKPHGIIDDAAFVVDEKVFAGVRERLSHTNSPYDFNSLPVHILGSIYERFLGKVITTTDKRAKVEEKPEVRKAGGVYYTPAYIVRYIVENTVGKMIAGKSPDEIAKMRFADIACGSGSFLLGVFDELLRYHTGYYNRNKRTRSEALRAGCIEREDGSLALSLIQKREILLRNIYGADIDAQAVEVAQLSLFLKLLEDETTATARQLTLLTKEALLPNLSSNIKCGNSLIGYDILGGHLFEPVEERKLNPMDFEQAFPEVMRRGGFDAIVGNPPYVNAWELFSNTPVLRDYINDGKHYKTADRHWDLYVLFLERALQLLKNDGYFSFIIPYSYSIQKYGILSRKMLLEQCTIESVADIRTVLVFGKVPVITIIPVVRKTPAELNSKVRIIKPSPDSTKTEVSSFIDSHDILQAMLLSQYEHMWRLDLSNEAVIVLEKINSLSIKMDDLCYINYGAQMSSKIKGKFGKEYVIRKSKDSEMHKKMISGRELYRYQIHWEERYVDWSFASQMYGARWEEFFELPKIMVRDITGTHRIEATFDSSGFYCDHTILCALRKCDVSEWKSATVEQIKTSQKYNLLYLTGLVASRLVSFYFYMMLTGEGVRTGGGFHTYPHTIRNFPIRVINFSNKAERARHDRMVTLVDQMLETKKLLQRPQMSDRDRNHYESKCAALDRHIDQLVYELYELTPEEIAIIEAS